MPLVLKGAIRPSCRTLAIPLPSTWHTKAVETWRSTCIDSARVVCEAGPCEPDLPCTQGWMRLCPSPHIASPVAERPNPRRRTRAGAAPCCRALTVLALCLVTALSSFGCTGHDRWLQLHHRTLQALGSVNRCCY